MLTKLSVRLTPTLCGLTPKNKLVALLLTWTCRAWKANDEQFDLDIVKILPVYV